MAQWEIRNKPGAPVAQTIEADSISLDKDRQVAQFWMDDEAKMEAMVALTPAMTITRRK
jgi:hypothetical protein